MSSISLRAHDMRSISDVTSSNRNKLQVRNCSFSQIAEERIKKRALAEAKVTREEKYISKRVGGALLHKFSKWLNQKHIRITKLVSKDARRRELECGKAITKLQSSSARSKSVLLRLVVMSAP